MLIEKDESGNWHPKGIRWEDLRIGKPITKEVSERLYGCLWKLMEYEDTGLSPGQVEAMSESLTAMEKQLLAEAEGEVADFEHQSN